MHNDDINNGIDNGDWEVIKSPTSFKIKSKLDNYYCKSRYFISIMHHIYKNGVNTVKLVNQLFWINYSMYPYLPPKLSFTISIVIVCIFLMNIKYK